MHFVDNAGDFVGTGLHCFTVCFNDLLGVAVLAKSTTALGPDLLPGHAPGVCKHSGGVRCHATATERVKKRWGEF